MVLFSVFTVLPLADGAVAWPVVTDPACDESVIGNCRGRDRGNEGGGAWLFAAGGRIRTTEAIIRINSSHLVILPPAKLLRPCREESPVRRPRLPLSN